MKNKKVFMKISYVIAISMLVGCSSSNFREQKIVFLKGIQKNKKLKIKGK